jgi:hypothetical protein
VSDKDVQANPEKYDGATAATADMLTADKIKWTLGATLSWATEKDEKEGTETPANGDDNGGDENGGENGNTPGGELEG